MRLNQLPSPEALKRIMIMIGVQRVYDITETTFTDDYNIYDFLDDIADDTIELSYDKEKDEYNFSQVPEGDEEYLYFIANPDFCYVATFCPEGCEELSADTIPADIFKRTQTHFGAYANFFAWSTDYKTWNQPEGFDSSTFPETVLDEFFDDFPGFDEETFRKECPVWYQVYKQTPFDNEMLLEARLVQKLSAEGPRATTPEALARLELPKVSPASTAKVLKYCFNYPTDLQEDYEPALTEAHIDELAAKGFYALAAYCVGRMLAAEPDNAALQQKAAEIYPQAEEVASTWKIYLGGEAGDDYDEDEDYDEEDYDE